MKVRSSVLRQFGVAVSAALLSSMAQATDVWDSAVDNDDSAAGTDNVLWHSAPPQVHDLQNQAGVADVDFYRIAPRAKRSYEVQVLNVTGDTNAGGLTMTRTNSTGVTTLQSAVNLDVTGFTRTMRWVQATDDDQRIRVTNNSTTSGFASRYDIQYRETTLYCPRYNQSGTQVSVLIIQRTDANSTASCSYTAYFFNEGGTQVGTTGGAMDFIDDVDVISVGGISGLTGQRGGAHIAHTCGMGGFKAKMVALEPATGFSFDTPCAERDR